MTFSIYQSNRNYITQEYYYRMCMLDTKCLHCDLYELEYKEGDDTVIEYMVDMGRQNETDEENEMNEENETYEENETDEENETYEERQIKKRYIESDIKIKLCSILIDKKYFHLKVKDIRALLEYRLQYFDEYEKSILQAFNIEYFINRGPRRSS